jgi:hypothetical protein
MKAIDYSIQSSDKHFVGNLSAQHLPEREGFYEDE